jgi:A/G-specific adenine glycosylase
MSEKRNIFLLFSLNRNFRTFADQRRMMNEFTRILLEWFRENGRDLPWRQTKDAYAIWLSEIILQQTQVKQGWAYWERFIGRWPTVESLAEASEDEVLREWQGLGYYSRARNLHFAARQIVEMGGFPNTLEGIRSLKGVGDYTAAAIGSFAFGLPAAVVDGNVYRVLSRHFGISTPINSTEGKKEFALLAQSLLPISQEKSQLSTPLHDRVGMGLYNQAIMDFGAMQCTPLSPKCASCPLMESCVAFREGRVSELPVKLKTLKVKERRLVYVYVRYQGETAIRRRGKGDIWQGLYEPVAMEERPFGAVCLRQNVKHVLTHRILWADFYLWEPKERPQLPEGYFWIKESELDDYAKPRLIEKYLIPLL